MEEKIQELLRIAKQNGTQATTVLLEIEQLLNGDNDEVQELLRIAKQNGTQATTVLLEIELLLNGDDEELQELLEKAKQNGTQATTVLTEIAEINSSKPKPIPVEGDVQIFANPECTEYATGEVSKVYARVNKPWGKNGAWNKGGLHGLVAFAPTTDTQEDDFGLQFYTEFTNWNGREPYEVGEVVELSSTDGVAVNVTNYDKVFSNPALPAEGDVQIFKDAACTEYATGVVDTVYVRVNKPWDESWQAGTKTDNNSFQTCVPEQPGDTYGMRAYVDFYGDREIPFETGQIVELSSGGVTANVTSYDKVFSKPQ